MTFVRAVATLLRPDAGTLHVAGIDALRQPARVRQVIRLAGGSQVEAPLAHTTAYYVGLSLIWTAAIVIVFGLVAALRFSRR